MTLYISIIILIIVISGIIGGWANYLLGIHSEETRLKDFFRSVILGIVAAATTPLWLKLLSSSLIEIQPVTDFNWIVFGGFCILSAVFSDKFLQSLSSKVINDLEKVKEKTKENQKATETLIKANSDHLDKIPHADVSQLDSVIKGEKILNESIAKVFSALSSDKYKFRTVKGINVETKLQNDEIETAINKLMDKNYVTELISGDTKYYTLKKKE